MEKRVLLYFFVARSFLDCYVCVAFLRATAKAVTGELLCVPTANVP